MEREVCGSRDRGSEKGAENPFSAVVALQEVDERQLQTVHVNMNLPLLEEISCLEHNKVLKTPLYTPK